MRGGEGIPKAIVLALTLAAVLPLSLPHRPAGRVFGVSYVVTDLETLGGQTIDAVAPQPYHVGTYVRGGDTTQIGISNPCPLGSYTIQNGNPAAAASALDYKWIHQY